MQAIITKFYAATATRGSRIVASCKAGKLSRAWTYGGEQHENDDAAALALVQKLGWVESEDAAYAGAWTRGVLADGSCVYVFTPRAPHAHEGFRA